MLSSNALLERPVLALVLLILLACRNGAGPDRSLAVLERHGTEGGHRRLRRKGDQGGLARFRRRNQNASPCSTMTARCGSSIPCTPSSPSRSTG